MHGPMAREDSPLLPRKSSSKSASASSSPSPSSSAASSSSSASAIAEAVSSSSVTSQSKLYTNNDNVNGRTSSNANASIAPTTTTPSTKTATSKKSTVSKTTASATSTPTNTSTTPSTTSTISTSAAIPLAILSGILGVAQTGVNSSLNRYLIPNPLAACATSFVVGLATMIVICVIHDARSAGAGNAANVDGSARNGGNMSNIIRILHILQTTPPHAFLGGLLGGTYKTTAIILAPKIGFASFHLAAVLGQLISGLICDSIGFLQLERVRVSGFKVGCVLCVLVGTGMSARWEEGVDNVNVVEDDGDVGSVGAILGCNCKGLLERFQTPLYLLLATLAGSVLPIQSCINFELSQHVGTTFHAVAINFFVGCCVMWSAAGVDSLWNDYETHYLHDGLNGRNGPITDREAGNGIHDNMHPIHTPYWVWSGGTLGAFLVVFVTFSLPTLGASTFSVIFIASQLSAAVGADAMGAFGYDVVPLWGGEGNGRFGGKRVLGVALAVGAAVIFKVGLGGCWRCCLRWCCCRKDFKSSSSHGKEEGEAEEEEGEDQSHVTGHPYSPVVMKRKLRSRESSSNGNYHNRRQNHCHKSNRIEETL